MFTYTAWGEGEAVSSTGQLDTYHLIFLSGLKKTTGNTRAALTQGGYLGYLMLQKMDVPGTAIT